MSRLSIYESRWIDLIFEHKNQAYGAYQLRRDSVKSSFTALFMGLLFVVSIGIIAKVISNFNSSITPIISSTEWSEPLEATEVCLQEAEKPVLPNVQAQATEATIDKDQLINPEIVHPQEANQNIATNSENQYAANAISDGTGTTGLNPSTSGNGTESEIPETIDYGNTVVNSAVVDKLPEFPGGIQKFYNYVGNNFEKPEIDEVMTIKVYVSFVIERDGSMTDIKVIKDPGYGLGREAIRVLKSLKTKWSPGMVGSKTVRTAYNLPIAVVMN